MKNEERKKISIGLLAVTGVVVLSLLMLTGRGQTSVAALGPPAEDKQAYCQFFEVPGNANEVAFIVPVGESFVLRKLIVCSTNTSYPEQSEKWSLTVDDNLLIDGRINRAGGEHLIGMAERRGTIYGYSHDFPDKCVVVNGGETLKVVSKSGYVTLATIIGYFSTVQ